MDKDAAVRLVGKLKGFVTSELEDDERALFAQLVAHGVALAHAEDDVSGFVMTEWHPSPLPAALVEALRESGLRVVGFDADEPTGH